MHCYLHSERDTELTCIGCGSPICVQCRTPVSEFSVCPQCLKDFEVPSSGVVAAEEARPRGSWFVEHFRHYRRLAPLPFCIRITVEGLIVSIIAGIVVALIGIHDRPIRISKAELFFIAVFVAPPLETLLLQALPVFLARIFRASFTAQVTFATIVFALAHLSNGVASFLVAGTILGFYFSFTYVHWREKSRWTAFWVTTATHFLHNLAVMPIVMMS
jgi:hypothetical protein